MSKEEWTIKDILSWTAEYFADKGINPPRFTAELLLCSALGCERLYLYTRFDRRLKEEERSKMRELVKRRVSGEPTQRIIGHAYFWSHRLKVDGRALVPRNETEHLVEVVIAEYLGAKDDALRLLEIGVGTGCVTIALAHEFAKALFWAVDIEEKALELARENLEEAGFLERVTLAQSDAFEGLNGVEPFDAIYSNPPYIKTKDIETLSAEVREHDPLSALDGGADGLDVIRKIARNAPSYLKRGGMLALEIGAGQAEEATTIFEESGFSEIKLKKDLQGIQRIIRGYLR